MPSNECSSMDGCWNTAMLPGARLESDVCVELGRGLGLNSEEPRGSEPPAWYIVLFWCYPILYVFVVGLPLRMLPPDSNLGGIYGPLVLVGFPVSVAFLYDRSAWFRKAFLVVLPVWLLLWGMSCSITQGALSAAISKAFSAVVSQTKNMQ